jgi:hypothetical protein
MCWDKGITNFLPRLALNWDPPMFTSGVAGIIDMTYGDQPQNAFLTWKLIRVSLNDQIWWKTGGEGALCLLQTVLCVQFWHSWKTNCYFSHVMLLGTCLLWGMASQLQLGVGCSHGMVSARYCCTAPWKPGWPGSQGASSPPDEDIQIKWNI